MREKTVHIKPLSVDFVYAGAIFEGGTPNPFRVLTCIDGLGRLADPIWATSQYITIYNGSISHKREKIVVKYAIEPNSEAFTLGGSIFQLEIPRWRMMGDGQVISSPIRLRTTESPVTQSQEITVRFKFAWHWK